MNKYPEHEKLKAISNQSQVCGEFLDWLYGMGFFICRWRDEGNNGEMRYLDHRTGEPTNDRDYRNKFNPEYESWGEGYVNAYARTEDLLAEFFNVDQDEIEDERRQMLEALRRAQDED